MLRNVRWLFPVIALAGSVGPVSADVITDWNEKAIAFVTKQRMLPPQAERVIASVHVAMFDAVNSIDRRYRPYRLAVTTTKETSKEAAATVAPKSWANASETARMPPMPTGRRRSPVFTYRPPSPPPLCGLTWHRLR